MKKIEIFHLCHQQKFEMKKFGKYHFWKYRFQRQTTFLQISSSACSVACPFAIMQLSYMISCLCGKRLSGKGNYGGGRQDGPAPALEDGDLEPRGHEVKLRQPHPHPTTFTDGLEFACPGWLFYGGHYPLDGCMDTLFLS